MPRQHKNCEICDRFKEFDLDEKVFIHGIYYTKEQIYNALTEQKLNKNITKNYISIIEEN